MSLRHRRPNDYVGQRDEDEIDTTVVPTTSSSAAACWPAETDHSRAMLPVHAPEKQEECETCDLETCDAEAQEDVEAGTTGQWARPALEAGRSVRPGPQLNE